MLGAFVNKKENGSALCIEDQKIVVRGETLRKSTAAWDVCYKWKDHSTSWEMLSNLKNHTQSRLRNMP